MKSLSAATLVAVLVLTMASADGAKRIAIAALPARVEAEEKPRDFDPAEYVLDQMIMGINKVERFDMVQAGDVHRLLDENLFKPGDVKLENDVALREPLALLRRQHVRASRHI